MLKDLLACQSAEVLERGYFDAAASNSSLDYDKYHLLL